MKKKFLFSLIFASTALLIFVFTNCFADSLYVCVDPGHGGSDDGTYGRVYGTKEKFANLKVGLALKDSIINDFEYWAVPIMTRETDVYLETPERANIAMGSNEYHKRANQFLVIHHNAPDTTPPNPPRPDSSINYTVTFYCDRYWVYPGDTIQRDVTGDLAERVNAKVKELLQNAVPSIPWGTHDAEITCFDVLRRTSMISALCEISFMTNHKIDSLYKYDATNYSRKEANGVYKGWHYYVENDPIIVVRNHFGGGYVLVDSIYRESPFHGCWRSSDWHTIGAFDQWWGDNYYYCKWSDSGLQQHTISVPTIDWVYTAYFSYDNYYVHVDAPNGGESYTIGQNIHISWTADAGVNDPPYCWWTYVDIYLSRDGGYTFTDTIVTDYGMHGFSSYYYDWTATGPTSNQCRIKIVAHDDACNQDYDVSNGNFSIDYTPLQPPSNLTATLSLNNRVHLTWTDSNFGTAKTKIYGAPCPCGAQNGCSPGGCRCLIPNGGSVWYLIATIDKGVTEWFDSLSWGSSYYGYRVTALRGSQESPPANDVIIRTHPNPPTNLFVQNFYCNRPVILPAKLTSSDDGISTFKSVDKPDCYPPFSDSILSDASTIYAGYPANQADCTYAGMQVWSKHCSWYNHNYVEHETTVVNLQGRILIQTKPDTVYCTLDLTYYFKVRTIDIYGDTSIFVPEIWDWPYACCVGPCHIPIHGWDNMAKPTIPGAFSLDQNHPNPFNPETQIKYALPQATRVKLVLYNVLGQKVRTLIDEDQPAGYKTVHWDGKDENGNEVGSGIYFYRLQAGEDNEARKMILMK